jgi:transcriptional regulator with XRE-family HTH domain
MGKQGGTPEKIGLSGTLVFSKVFPQTSDVATDWRAAARAAEVRMSQLGLTQAQLAERAQVDVSTVSTFLNGHHRPQARTRAKIEAALEWPSGTLVDVAGGGRPPGREQKPGADPVEAQIRSIPHLLDEDRELFLRVYRTRRDEQTARRLADLEQLLEASLRSVSDPEVRETIADQFRQQIEQLKLAGYSGPPRGI